MSQLPTDPYGNPPPPPPYGQQPPPGYATPGGYPPAAYAPAARTSAASVTSLVLGIVLCVPFVTSLLAVIFGIVGIRATKTPAVKGRGLAIAGLILGVLGLVLWTTYFAVAGVMAVALFKGGLNPMIAQGFFQQMSAGDVQKATAMCVPGTSPAAVQATVDQMKRYGRMTSFNASNNSTVNGMTTLDGTIQFQTGGSHPFHAVVGKGGSSPVPQVQSWDLK